MAIVLFLSKYVLGLSLPSVSQGSAAQGQLFSPWCSWDSCLLLLHQGAAQHQDLGGWITSNYLNTFQTEGEGELLKPLISELEQMNVTKKPRTAFIGGSTSACETT